MKAILKFLLVFIVFTFLTIPAYSQINPIYGEKIKVTYNPPVGDMRGKAKVDPTLSPNGKWIAFINTVSDNSEGIWLVPVEGGVANLLYQSRDVNYLRFMPDGKEVAFEETELDTINTTEIDIPEGTIQSPTWMAFCLKAVNVETKEIRTIVKNAHFSSISANGRYISYINSDPKVAVDELQAEHNGSVTIYDTLSGEKRFLIDVNLPVYNPGKYHYPAISPDLKWVYFGSYVEGKSYAQLYRIPFEGGEIEQLSSFKEVSFSMCRNMNFSPDGKWFLFDNVFDVLVYNIENGKFFEAFSGQEIDSPLGPPEDEPKFENSPNLVPNGTAFVYTLVNGGRLSGSITPSTIGNEVYYCNFDVAKYATNPTVVKSATPLDFSVLTNYPNPFNPTTTIEFNLTKPENVNLSIYNLTGQKVCELASGDMTPGKHSYVWNGRDSKGTPVSSGIFFTRLETRDNVISNRMMLVK